MKFKMYILYPDSDISLCYNTVNYQSNLQLDYTIPIAAIYDDKLYISDDKIIAYFTGEKTYDPVKIKDKNYINIGDVVGINIIGLVKITHIQYIEGVK